MDSCQLVRVRVFSKSVGLQKLSKKAERVATEKEAAKDGVVNKQQ